MPTPLVGPPRLTGDDKSDLRSMVKWFQDFANVTRQDTARIESDIAALAERITALENRVNAIAGLAYLDQVISNPVTGVQGANIQDKVNAIIQAVQ